MMHRCALAALNRSVTHVACGSQRCPKLLCNRSRYGHRPGFDWGIGGGSSRMVSISRSGCLGIGMAVCATLGSTASAQAADARLTMERCVDRVLLRLANSRASEAQVGRAVIVECDIALREAVASAIATGEAFVCSVESCMWIARERAADEAISAYRQRLSEQRLAGGGHQRTADRSRGSQRTGLRQTTAARYARRVDLR